MSEYKGPRILINFGKHQIIKVVPGITGTQITIAIKDRLGRGYPLEGVIPASTSVMDIRAYLDWITLYHDSGINVFTEIPMRQQ